MKALVTLALGALALSSCSAGEGASAEEGPIAACIDDAGYDDEDLSNWDYQRQLDPAFDAAMIRCYKKGGVDLPEAGALTRLMDEVLLAEVQCMREKGWDVPDPVRLGEGEGLSLAPLDGYVPEEQFPAFDADLNGCSDEVAPPDKAFDVNDPDLD